MAAFTLMGRRFDPAPYKLGQLREAAQHIDRVNAISVDGMRSLASVSTVIAVEMVAVLAIGLRRLDPEMTAARLSDGLTTANLPELQNAFLAVITEAGLGGRQEQASPASGGPVAGLVEQLERLVMMLVAAGVEGGSKPRIERHWTLRDVYALQDHWREFGPPAHIAISAFASAWGVKLTSDKPVEQLDQEDELAALLASLPMVQR